MSTITLHNATETTSGTGTTTLPATPTFIGMFINISEVSGTLPTLDVTLQHSPNGADWYNAPNSNVAVKASTLSSTGTTSVYPSTNPTYLADNVRCVWTIGGTNPSFTFDVELTTL